MPLNTVRRVLHDWYAPPATAPADGPPPVGRPGPRDAGWHAAAALGRATPGAVASHVSESAHGGPHILTVALEDYYHNFNRLIERSHWHRFEKRVEHSTLRALDLLDEYGVRATFFALGWVAETLPELIGEVVRRGHEVASKGYSQRSVRDISREEFRDDLAQAREALERASGRRVVGYRAPGWLKPADLWALDILAEDGYEYDSSIKPLFRSYHAEPWRRFAHQNRIGERTLWEFPISSIRAAGLSLPIGAGNYFRQLPRPLIRRAVEHWHRTNDAPFTMYFHTWELDPGQPHITAAPLLNRIRLYRNLEEVSSILAGYFERYRFTGIADYLGLGAAEPLPAAVPAPPRRLAIAVETETRAAPRADAAARGAASGERPATPTKVTLVLPCYNEERTLPYLANTLRSVEASLADAYTFDLLFVDDCSVDGTWDALHRIFGSWPNCTFVRHDRNRGVAAGILTGLRSARTEIAASIDCDCTYDPHELGRMIPLLTDGVDLVTGSPYHQLGGVRNVPRWRLALSKSASALYRVVLRQKLHTYTSCFRVYRRSAALAVQVESGGFLGVAEMIGKLDLAGATIVEYPTTLNVRVLGRSKMKVVRTVIGHVGLLARLAALRATGRLGRRPAPPIGESAAEGTR